MLDKKQEWLNTELPALTCAKQLTEGIHRKIRQGIPRHVIDVSEKPVDCTLRVVNFDSLHFPVCVVNNIFYIKVYPSRTL
jgi:hypothetical protein